MEDTRQVQNSNSQQLPPTGYIPPNIPMNQRRSYMQNDQLDFIQALLEKDELKKQIPPELSLYVTTFVKNLAISNLNDKDIKYIMNSFDDMKTAWLMRQPPGAYNWEIEYCFTSLRPLIYTEACRAKDGFERRMMATSINQTYMQSDFRQQAGGGYGGGGIFGKIRNWIGRY